MAPQCATDFLWWALLTTLGILGSVIAILIKKGVIERLDKMSEKQDEFITDCHRCQEETRKEFVGRSEYNDLIKIREQTHKLLDGRVLSLETGQDSIAKMIDRFQDDISRKISRLSQSFIGRDLVYSIRLDNIADKIGMKWDKDKEDDLQNKLVAEIIKRDADESK